MTQSNLTQRGVPRAVALVITHLNHQHPVVVSGQRLARYLHCYENAPVESRRRLVTTVCDTANTLQWRRQQRCVQGTNSSLKHHHNLLRDVKHAPLWIDNNLSTRKDWNGMVMWLTSQQGVCKSSRSTEIARRTVLQ